MLPLLSLLVEDHHGRKTGDPNIDCLLFYLECPLPCAQEQVLEGLSVFANTVPETSLF